MVEAEGKERKRDSEMLHAGSEDREGPQPRRLQALEAGQGRDRVCPPECPQGIQPCSHLDFGISDLQSISYINMYSLSH